MRKRMQSPGLNRAIFATTHRAILNDPGERILVRFGPVEMTPVEKPAEDDKQT